MVCIGREHHDGHPQAERPPGLRVGRRGDVIGPATGIIPRYDEGRVVVVSARPSLIGRGLGQHEIESANE